MSYSGLRAALVRTFTKSELTNLCQDLSVNPELVFNGVGGIDVWAHELVSYFDKCNWLPELLLGLAQARPKENWAGIYQDDLARLSAAACPYPGMVPFTSDGAFLFCGRETEIAEMVQRIRHQHFLLVIGSSGSGKSSLVKAGVLPHLAKTEAFPAGFWLARTLQPSTHPLQTLAECLGTPAEQAAECDHACVAALLKAYPPAQKLLLVVDQFEETFSQNSPEVQRAFIAAIMNLCNREDCTVIITMRADYYDQLMNSRLWELAEHQRMDVTALKGDALRNAIQTPAQNAEVTLEPDLVERLLADAEDQPGALPLIQETLVQLWQARQNDLITLTAYEAMGREGRSGLSVALETVANATLSNLSQPQRKLARRILLDLVQLGEPGLSPDTRRREYWDELRANRDSEFDRTLESLTRNRLVTQGSDHAHRALVELAHDSLLNGWPQLKTWLDEDRDKLRLQRQLSQATDEWLTRQRDEGALYGGSRLDDALAYQEEPLKLLSADEVLFLEQSNLREAARERTRYRGQLFGLVIGAGAGYGLLFCIAAISTFVERGVNIGRAINAAFIVSLAMISLGGLVGAGIGWGLWISRDIPKFRPAISTALAAAVGIFVYPLFITFAFPIPKGKTISDLLNPSHFATGFLLAASLGLSIGLVRTKSQRLIFIPLAGLIAGVLASLSPVPQISRNPFLAGGAGLVMGLMTAMAYHAAAVPVQKDIKGNK